MLLIYNHQNKLIISFLIPFMKIKLHIFQNIYKCSVHRLIPFKYNNTCELCDNIPDKENIERIMVKKFFALRDEVIDVFHDKFYIPTIEKLAFYIVCVRIFGSMECGKTKNDFPS